MGKKLTAVFMSLLLVLTGNGTLTAHADEPDTTYPAFTISALSQTQYTYDGASHIPTFTVTDNSQSPAKTLTKDKDYTVNYDDDANRTGNTTDSGTKYILISGIGDYANHSYQITKTYTIAPMNIDDEANAGKFTVSEAEPLSYEYDGTSKKAAVEVKGLNGATLTEKQDYTLLYSADTVSQGDKTITVTPAGNYTGTPIVRTYKINPMDVDTDGNATNFVVGTVSPSTYTYNGSSQIPSWPVYDQNGNPLNAGTDYTLTASEDSTNVGTKTLTLTPAGNYKGKARTATYTITPLSVTKNEITVAVDPSTTTYDRTNKINTGVISVSVSGFGVISTDDYTVEKQGTDWTNVGNYNITISMNRNFTCPDTVPYTFTVVKAVLDKVPANYKWSIEDTTYNGTRQEQPVTIVDKNGNILTAGTDYTVTYPANEDFTNAGTKTVKVYAQNNYMLDTNVTELTATYMINPISFNTNDFTITAPDTTYNFDIQKQTPTIRQNTADKAISNDNFTITYPDSDYTSAGIKHITITPIANGNYAGDPITITYEIKPLKLTSDDVVLTAADVGYDGKEHKQVLTVTSNLRYASSATRLLKKSYQQTFTEGTDYIVSYPDADYVDCGTKKAVATFTGNFTSDPMETSYAITEYDANANPLSVKMNPVTYDKKVHKQPALITDKFGNTLVEGKDYTVSYPDTDYVNVGTNNATITLLGNYVGEDMDETYNINPANSSTLTIKIGSVDYDGIIHKQPAVVTDAAGNRLVEGTDYTVSYPGRDYKNVGQKLAVVKVMGNYIGNDRLATFHILATSYTADDNSRFTITVANVTYDGQEHKQPVIVYDALTGKDLELNVDYTLDYVDDNYTTAGTKNININLMGNYNGTLPATYEIVDPMKNAKANAFLNSNDRSADTGTGEEIPLAAAMMSLSTLIALLAVFFKKKMYVR